MFVAPCREVVDELIQKGETAKAQYNHVTFIGRAGDEREEITFDYRY